MRGNRRGPRFASDQHGRRAQPGDVHGPRQNNAGCGGHRISGSVELGRRGTRESVSALLDASGLVVCQFQSQTDHTFNHLALGQTEGVQRSRMPVLHRV